MELAELRRRVGTILAAEEMQDWAEVVRSTDELQRELLSMPRTSCPEIVDHYLDDLDIRATDERYGEQQRRKVRRFVETGEHDDGTVVSPWTCAAVLALVIALIALIGWLVW